MKNNLMSAVLLFSVLFLPVNGLTNGSSDYLILQDIGQYKLSQPEKLIPGFAPVGGPRIYENSGIIAGAGHFNEDHIDKTYTVMYLGGNELPSPTVEVTQHAGSDSDKWLLHEVEDGYRDGETERLGLITQGARLRDINGNKIISLRGSGYSWISNNIVVEISYTDLDGTKPEPLEVIQAYLQKFPSTIPTTLVLDKTHDEQWIKDEMDRRLWLGGKWMGQIKTAGDLDKLSDVVKNLNVFLDYREKYYGIEVGAEKNVLFTAQQNKDKTTIEAKLNEYYKWWNENKDKAINL